MEHARGRVRNQLVQQMAGGQGNFTEHCRVPGVEHDSPAAGIVHDRVHALAQLVDRLVQQDLVSALGVILKAGGLGKARIKIRSRAAQPSPGPAAGACSEAAPCMPDCALGTAIQGRRRRLLRAGQLIINKLKACSPQVPAYRKLEFFTGDNRTTSYLSEKLDQFIAYTIRRFSLRKVTNSIKNNALVPACKKMLASS